MSDTFDDSAPIPKFDGYGYIAPPEEPLDDRIEKLMDALGITKRRHLRSHIRWLIADAEERVSDSFSYS